MNMAPWRRSSAGLQCNSTRTPVCQRQSITKLLKDNTVFGYIDWAINGLIFLGFSYTIFRSARVFRVNLHVGDPVRKKKPTRRRCLLSSARCRSSPSAFREDAAFCVLAESLQSDRRSIVRSSAGRCDVAGSPSVQTRFAVWRSC